MHANLRQLFAEVEAGEEPRAFSPMQLLQLISWLQDYSERLQALEAPAVHPSFRGVQQALIDAYARKTSAKWHDWAANLHAADVAAISEGRWEERPDGSLGTMAPVDLLRMLSEPFDSLESLQVPLLSNAVVAACGAVISGYGELQRENVRGACTTALQAGLDGSAVTLCTTAMCTFMSNAERAIEYIDQLRKRIERPHSDEAGEEMQNLGADASDDDNDNDEEVDGVDEGEGLKEHYNAAAADDALRDAEFALGSVTSSGGATLVACALFFSATSNPPFPLQAVRIGAATQLLDDGGQLDARLDATRAALQATQPLLPEHVFPKLVRSTLQMAVAMGIEALLCAKTELDIEAALQRAMLALQRFSDRFDLVGRQQARQLAPLSEAARLARASGHEFAAAFDEVRVKHAEVSVALGEAIIARRFPKAGAKPLLEQLRAHCDEALPPAAEAWPPRELAPLGNAPFSLAASRSAARVGGMLHLPSMPSIPSMLSMPSGMLAKVASRPHGLGAKLPSMPQSDDSPKEDGTGAAVAGRIHLFGKNK